MKTLTHLFKAHRIIILSLLLVAGISIAGIVPPVFGGGAPRISQERYLEIAEISGTVTYDYEPLKATQARPAKVGDRLRRPGDGVTTGSGSRARLTVDNGIGSVDVPENSSVRVRNLSRTRNGATNTDLALNRGRVRSQVRSFNNSRSRFSIQTPAGVAGVRGTEFVTEVLPNGEMRVITIDGTVEVSGAGQSRQVKAGYFSTIAAGNPPTIPTGISRNVRVNLQLLPVPDVGKVRVSGVVSSIDSVFINARALDVNPLGRFDTIVPLPIDGILRVTVRNPLDEERVYELVGSPQS